MRNTLRYSLKFWLLLILILGISSCTSLNKSNSQSGLLWRISQPGYQTSYLFGTIHSEDPKVLSVLPHVLPSLGASDQFVMEVEMTPDSVQIAANAMYYRNGRTLKDSTDSQLYKRSLDALAKKGFQEDFVRYLKPWSVFTILSMPQPKTGEFMDVKLMNSAKQGNKKIAGLESMQDQIAVFDDMPEQQQIILLKDTLDHLDEMDGLLDDTIRAYLTRDLANLDQLNEQYLSLLDPAVKDTFLDRLIYQRNKNMLNAALPLMKQNKSFIAVGALHLVGDKGLIALLRAQGFTVTSVY